MLGVAGWLNLLVRKSKDVGIACIAQSVNVISPVMTSPDGLLFQTTYFPCVRARLIVAQPYVSLRR